MPRWAILLILGAAGASPLARQAPPSDLGALTIKARLTGTIVAHCAAEFEVGRPGAFAVAVVSPDGVGRYVALHPDGVMQEILPFVRTAELSCYPRDQALKLHATMQKSGTLNGALEPRFDTTVVCTHLDATAATCWQYSPAVRDFVKVGQWKSTPQESR